MIIIRSHFFDEEIHKFVERLCRQGADVVVGMDETHHTVDVSSDVRKISLNEEVIQSMGLHLPADVGWRCGDYLLYATRMQFPEHSHYWMLEPDIRLKTRSTVGFFEEFEAAQEVDLIALQLSQADDKWFWSSTMNPLNAEVWRCSFGLIRLSGVAIDHLLTERRNLSGLVPSSPELGHKWPNDESFVATTLSSDGFICRDLNSFGVTRYTRSSFTLNRPMSASLFDRLPEDGLVYHPVLGGAQFSRRIERQFDSACKKARRRKSLVPLVMFDSSLFEQMEVECGPAASGDLRSRLEGVVRELGYPLWTFQTLTVVRSAFNWVMRSHLGNKILQDMRGAGRA